LKVKSVKALKKKIWRGEPMAVSILKKMFMKEKQRLPSTA
jgi:hypothetical protein